MAFDADLFKFYKSAIDLRHRHESLRRGEFVAAGTNDDTQTVAYERRGGSENLLVAFNRSEQEQSIPVELPAGDKAKFAKANVIFSTNGDTSRVGLDISSGGIIVKLPGLSGAVIAP